MMGDIPDRENKSTCITGVQSKQRQWITTLCTQCTSNISLNMNVMVAGIVYEPEG